MKAQYANQNIYQINREFPKAGANRSFLTIYCDNVYNAFQNLSGEAAIKLYVYLASNKDGYNLNFSPKHFATTCGMSEASARAAAKQLIEKGYLVQDANNHYQFYEVPQITKQFVIRPSEYRVARYENGTTAVVSYNDYYNNLKEYYSLTEIDASWNELPIAEGK